MGTLAKETDATEIREMAKLFRDTADTAEKMADCIEDPESTEEQQEAALKEFTWAVMKLQLGGAAIGK